MKSMFKYESQSISATIMQYFEGVYYGDIGKLQTAFDPHCLLRGDIDGQPYHKTLPEYFETVKNRRSPHALGEPFCMEILSVEVLNTIAVTRLHVPMLGYNYYDFLTLNKRDGAWVIVNKAFTHVKP